MFIFLDVLMTPLINATLQASGLRHFRETQPLWLVSEAVGIPLASRPQGRASFYCGKGLNFLAAWRGSTLRLWDAEWRLAWHRAIQWWLNFTTLRPKMTTTSFTIYNRFLVKWHVQSRVHISPSARYARTDLTSIVKRPQSPFHPVSTCASELRFGMSTMLFVFVLLWVLRQSWGAWGKSILKTL